MQVSRLCGYVMTRVVLTKLMIIKRAVRVQLLDAHVGVSLALKAVQCSFGMLNVIATVRRGT